MLEKCGNANGFGPGPCVPGVIYVRFLCTRMGGLMQVSSRDLREKLGDYLRLVQQESGLSRFARHHLPDVHSVKVLAFL